MTNRVRVWLVTILVVAFLLRLAWAVSEGRAAQPRNELGGDAYGYEVAGQSIASGDGYTGVDGAPTAYHPPGYPYLVGATYLLSDDAVIAPKLLNVALGTLAVLLTFSLGCRLFTRATGLVAAAILAVWPGVIFFVALPMPEAVTTVLVAALLLGGLSLTERPTPLRFLAAGLALGAAVLIRTELMLLPLAFLPELRRNVPARAALSATLFAAALALMLAPWVIRNSVRMDSVTFSTGFGDNVYVGHNPLTDGGGQLHDALFAQYADLSPAQREVAYNRAATREALRYVRDHPGDDLALIPGRLQHLWVGDDPALYIARGFDLTRTGRDRLLSLTANVFWYFVIGAAALSVPSWIRFNRRQWSLPIVVLSWCILFGVVTHGEQRYHVALAPVLAILAARTVVLAWAAIRRRAGATSSASQTDAITA